MNKIFSVLAILVLLGFAGCATMGDPVAGDTNPLDQISQNLDPYAVILARDWPKASGLIRGGLPEGVLPANIVTKMNEIDKWFQHEDGTWFNKEEMQNISLNWYQEYYIVGARGQQIGPVLQALIQQYAPGLLNIPAVMTGLTFLGLGVL